MSTSTSKNKKKGLGRGLGTLLGGHNTKESAPESLRKTKSSTSKKAMSKGATQKIQTKSKKNNGQPKVIAKNINLDETPYQVVAIHMIEPNPDQPRKNFDEVKLKELSDSIFQKGILQPIVVVKKADKRFQIIAGERRWRAAQKAGLKKVPIIIEQETNEQEIFELAIIENIQRADLNPIEEAHAYAKLINDYDLTQAEIAVKVGKERSSITNILRLLKLDESVQNAVLDGKISQGHAKVLASLELKSAQKKLLKEMLLRGLSVRQTEQRAKAIQAGEGSSEGLTIGIKNVDFSEYSETDLKTMARQLTKKTKTKSQIKLRANGSGKIELTFYSTEQMNHLVDKLLESEWT